MKQNLCLNTLLLSFYCLSNLQWTWAAAAETETTTGATPEVVTEALEAQELEHPSPCFVEKSKVNSLLLRVDAAIRVFNELSFSIPCSEYSQRLSILIDEFCAVERITKIERDLTEVTEFRFQPLEELWEENLSRWNVTKTRIIKDLKALSVFDSPSPCGSSWITLYPFKSMVQHLDHLMDKFLQTQQTRLLSTPPRIYPACASNSKYTDRKAVSTIFEGHISFLLKALNSEMALYAKSVPNLKLVSRDFEVAPDENRTDDAISLTESPQCNVDDVIFNEWNDKINNQFKDTFKLNTRTKIHLPSVAASCVAILKVAHSAVSELKSRVGKGQFCGEFRSLRNVVGMIQELFDEFGRKQHIELMTKPHKTRWESILTEFTNLQKPLSCLESLKSGDYQFRECPQFSRPPVFYQRVDDEDANWYIHILEIEDQEAIEL